jgi:hypothetical protein
MFAALRKVHSIGLFRSDDRNGLRGTEMKGIEGL